MRTSFAAIACFMLLLTVRAHALITIVEVGRASAVKSTTSTTGAVTGTTIYGGLAGDAARCGAGPNSTSDVCNNCLVTETVPAADPNSLLLPCNERRINPNLQLSIRFSSDATSGLPTVVSETNNIALTLAQSPTTTTKGNQTTVYIAWGTICAQMATDGAAFDNVSQCIPTGGKATGRIRVGISADSSGRFNGNDDQIDLGIEIRSIASPSIATDCGTAKAAGIWQVCYFEVGPGDEKAIARNVTGPDITFPGTDYKFVRFLYAAQDFKYVTMASDHKDLPIELNDAGTFNVTPRRIDSLKNDTTYYFKTALVDVAGNVGFYSGKANDSSCENSPYQGRPCRSTTPSEVAGVLDATNCFIATAAYGTPFAKELDTLRDFRDQILQQTSLGRSFIHFYYAKSPYYARMILNSPVARSTVRAALVPVVWFAGMTLAYGPLKAGLAFLASLIFVAALVHLGRARFTSKSANQASVRRSLLPVIIAAMLFPAVTFSSRAHADIPKDVLLDDVPPEPEYPYPSAAASTTPSSKVLKPAPVEKWQQPKAITEDGDYIYDKLPDTPEKKYAPPKKKKYRGMSGREAPATISADGEFIYDVQESEFTGAAGFRVGFMSPPAIKNNSNKLDFKNIYGGNDIPGLLIEYEYPLTRSIGRIGLKFETGAYAAQAQGRFLKGNQPEIPEETFTFVMVPLQAMLHYRFQFADRQLVVPFVEGGAAYNGIVELRDDNKAPKLGGAPAVIAGVGLNILLDWMDKQGIRQLDAEYGINHVWLTAQYRQIVGLKKDIDFTSHLISAGFTVDF